ncbi:LuxR C-terminal-related transcriptional regulator [Streptomyces sp. NPDC004031]
MTERPFEALGLSPDADRAYSLLVSTRGVAAAELARQMAVSADRGQAACGELAARGLARRGRDGRWYPVPPHAGFRPLLSHAQEQLRLGRELLDRLDAEYQRVHEGYRADEAVQVVAGHAAIGRRVAEVQGAAAREITAFVPGAAVAPRGAVPAGVRRRVVFERAGLEAAGAFGPPGDPLTTGRVTGRLPARLEVVDAEVALMPPPEAAGPEPVLLVVLAGPLLGALTALFDAVWAGSVPLGRRPDAQQPRSALRLRVLGMLVSGSTDAAMARSLGVAVRTVQRHVAAMQREAGVDNRVQLVWHAARNGWLDELPEGFPEGRPEGHTEGNVRRPSG